MFTNYAQTILAPCRSNDPKPLPDHRCSEAAGVAVQEEDEDGVDSPTDHGGVVTVEMIRQLDQKLQRLAGSFAWSEAYTAPW